MEGPWGPGRAPTEQGLPPQGVWGSVGSTWWPSAGHGAPLASCSFTVPVKWPAGLGVPQGSRPEPKRRARCPCLGSLGHFLLGQSHMESGQALLLGLVSVGDSVYSHPVERLLEPR